ncbi:MAG: PucR family transcriptional regulator ligand-binding domain-containing protein, partial [Candidatus Pararuminococcus gallinarum]
MEMTVAQALTVGALAQCKLIGGAQGVQKKISWVDTMEVPNISPWLKKNELLITTGYAIKNDTDALTGLIEDLYRVQAAGLAIKTRFLGSISEDTIALADRLQVPLIEIPPDIPFIDITHPLMKALVDEHNNKLEFSELMNAKFMELEL